MKSLIKVKSSVIVGVGLAEKKRQVTMGAIMFIILVYDINIKRVAKVNKICKKYLQPVQKSVFEGEITEKKFRMLQNELKRQIDTSVDSVCVYQLESMKYTYKIQIGPNDNINNIL